ncbi:MAG TPA: hypothetical protein VK633_08870 [Verrucomicrobiae bacterium]|nr:hypothetical protein [Verrucomicrobiae bacterium]
MAVLLLKPYPQMQTNQKNLKTVAALLNLGSQPGFNSPFQDFADLTGPIVGALKGIRFAGLFGSKAASIDTADKESNRLAYEMKQTLGIKGFILNLTGSAGLATGLPACWDAIRPCMDTLELEDATARILNQAASLAEGLGKTNQKSTLRLNQVEASQLQAGLDFYHFVFPKMLVLTSALRLACDKEMLKRGIGENRAPQAKAVGADGLQDLFRTIRGILSLSNIKGAIEMPGSWMKYLAAASAQLKPVVQGENYNRAAEQLLSISCELAPGFQSQVGALEMDELEAVAKQVSKLEAFLPSLIMSITLLELFFRPSEGMAPLRLASESALKASPKTAPEAQLALRSALWLATAQLCPA